MVGVSSVIQCMVVKLNIVFYRGSRDKGVLATVKDISYRGGDASSDNVGKKSIVGVADRDWPERLDGIGVILREKEQVAVIPGSTCSFP